MVRFRLFHNISLSGPGQQIEKYQNKKTYDYSKMVNTRISSSRYTYIYVDIGRIGAVYLFDWSNYVGIQTHSPRRQTLWFFLGQLREGGQSRSVLHVTSLVSAFCPKQLHFPCTHSPRPLPAPVKHSNSQFFDVEHESPLPCPETFTNNVPIIF